MSKRKRKGAVEGGEATEAAAPDELDIKLDAGLKSFDHAMRVGVRVRQKVASFKRRGKITPGSIRRLLSEITAATE
jgi:hypothetical protein